VTDHQRPTVSVVVRALNEAQHLGRLLHGLQNQTVLPDEIIVVDSGSTDDTPRIAERAGCVVKSISKDEFSFGRALNLGCDASSSDLIVILSAHVYPLYDTYVEHMIGAFGREGVDVAYGRQVGDHRTKFSESRIMLRWFPTKNIWDQGHPFSNNANAAVRRRAWEQIRYDESLTGLEDLAFAKEVMRRGSKVAYVADAPVVHVHEETWAAIRNRYRREAIAYSRIERNSAMSLPTAVYLATKNTLADYVSAIRSRQIAPNLTSIPRFRIAQFLGAWEGFRMGDQVSRDLIQRFYYPPDSSTPEDSALPGKPIAYANFTDEERSSP
jgi:rhamnosyltransferase